MSHTSIYATTKKRLLQ